MLNQLGCITALRPQETAPSSDRYFRGPADKVRQHGTNCACPPKPAVRLARARRVQILAAIGKRLLIHVGQNVFALRLAHSAQRGFTTRSTYPASCTLVLPSGCEIDPGSRARFHREPARSPVRESDDRGQSENCSRLVAWGNLSARF